MNTNKAGRACRKQNFSVDPSKFFVFFKQKQMFAASMLLIFRKCQLFIVRSMLLIFFPNLSS